MNIAVDYLGLRLRTPFVIGASPVSDTLVTACALQDVGAAAIVMRSLFHEQMRQGGGDHARAGAGRVGNATDFPEHASYQLTPGAYLKQIEALKKTLTIPVIASLNGHRPAGWGDYARLVEDSGADAIELNFYQVVADPGVHADQVELEILKTVSEVASMVRIPVAVKLSPFHTAVAQLAVAVECAGARGVVVFNRFYQPDVDTQEVTVVPRLDLSDSSELLLRLRWLAILSPLLRGTLVASGGVHTGNDVVKALLTGAHAVQVVSAVLRQGPPAIKKLIRGLETWMRQHHYSAIDQIRGLLNLSGVPNPAALERAHYINVLQSRTA